MLSPNTPTNIAPKDLRHWIQRCCDRSNASAYHLRLGTVLLTLHPARGALARKGSRQVLIDHDGDRHTGRGWLDHLEEDVRKAVATINQGGGEPIPLCLGDRIRIEVANRSARSTLPEYDHGRNAPEARQHWVEWMEDDELDLLLGAWIYHAGMIFMEVHAERRDKVDFYPSNDEFELAARVNPSHLFVTLKRLAHQRMLRAGVVHEETTE